MKKPRIRWPTKVRYDPERAKAMKEYQKKVKPLHEAFRKKLKEAQHVSREVLDFEITI